MLYVSERVAYVDSNMYRAWVLSLVHLSEYLERRSGKALLNGNYRQYPDACVIWVDAHADINTVESTGSGTLVCISHLLPTK